jgi:hypothetical protein
LTPFARAATLPAMNPADRLALSERTVAAWERNGLPGGPVADNLLMIRDELAILSKLAATYPGQAGAVHDLSQRYGVIANRLRLSAN